MAAEKMIFSIRGSEGVCLKQGLTSSATTILSKPDAQTMETSSASGPARPAKVSLFSPNGRFFAFCDGFKTEVLDLEMNKTVLSADLFRTAQLFFSPRSTYLCTWEPYAVYGMEQKQAEPNLRIWHVASGRLLKTFVQKKHSQWHPHFTDDESIMCRLVGTELFFHTDTNFEKYSKKLVLERMSDFSISTGQSPYHIACYISASKGQPAVVQVRHYPDWGVIANKTFWKADRVSLFWNRKGTALIVMAITDVDSTGQSYYGEQNLYLVRTDGHSTMVPLGKNGPVYSIDWNPSSSEFCVVYGYMPAKATLYNSRGEPIFDFGTGPRNECHYNAQGSLLCLCGFGNLRGNMEFWSPREKKKVTQLKGEDTTIFDWAPDGQHFCTATTSPRLRVNNGYKIWRYTGEILVEVPTTEKEELWEVRWRPGAPNDYPDLTIAFPSAAVAETPSGVQLPGVNKNSAYVPPHLRNRAPGAPPPKKFTIHENEPAESEKKGKKGAKSEDPEVEKAKKIRNLQRKLDQIGALKDKKIGGEKLEKNQLEKIEKETELREEMERLSAS